MMAGPVRQWYQGCGDTAGQVRDLGGITDVAWYLLDISSRVGGHSADNTRDSDQHSSLSQSPWQGQ